MQENFKQVENKLVWAQKLDANTFEEIQDFFEDSKKAGCEGLMIKTLSVDATYEPSKRTFKWLKMKKDYLDDGMVDTFDLVPIASQHGIGKRTGKRVSSESTDDGKDVHGARSCFDEQ